MHIGDSCSNVGTTSSATNMSATQQQKTQAACVAAPSHVLPATNPWHSVGHAAVWKRPQQPPLPVLHAQGRQSVRHPCAACQPQCHPIAAHSNPCLTSRGNLTLVVAFTTAPAASSSFTTAVWPFRAALCRGVWRFCGSRPVESVRVPGSVPGSGSEAATRCHNPHSECRQVMRKVLGCCAVLGSDQRMHMH
jgi:hypothetical protein